MRAALIIYNLILLYHYIGLIFFFKKYFQRKYDKDTSIDQTYVDIMWFLKFPDVH